MRNEGRTYISKNAGEVIVSQNGNIIVYETMEEYRKIRDRNTRLRDTRFEITIEDVFYSISIGRRSEILSTINKIKNANERNKQIEIFQKIYKVAYNG